MLERALVADQAVDLLPEVAARVDIPADMLLLLLAWLSMLIPEQGIRYTLSTI